MPYLPESGEYVQPVRLGMVGGGNEAFIGSVHRMAARLDDRYRFVAGALSSTPERSRASGNALGLNPDRSYNEFTEMAMREAARPDGIEAVSIVTPNHLHAAAAVLTETDGNTGRSKLAEFGQTFVSRGFTMYPVIVLMFIIGAITAPAFLTTVNLINIGAQIAVLGIVTLGLSFALMLGRLDLSLESTVGFAPMVAAMLMATTDAGGFGVQLPGWVGILITLGIAIIIGILFRYHRFGRAIYAVGGNEDAARAAGINVDRIIFSSYVIASLLAGIGGIILTGRLDSVVTTQGDGLIFNCFAAAVIGGVSLGGGRGTVIGAISGVILIGVINNLLTLAQVPSFWVQASTGAIIIVAAVLAAVASNRSTTVKTRT